MNTIFQYAIKTVASGAAIYVVAIVLSRGFKLPLGSLKFRWFWYMLAVILTMPVGVWSFDRQITVEQSNPMPTPVLTSAPLTERELPYSPLPLVDAIPAAAQTVTAESHSTPAMQIATPAVQNVQQAATERQWPPVTTMLIGAYFAVFGALALYHCARNLYWSHRFSRLPRVECARINAAFNSACESVNLRVPLLDCSHLLPVPASLGVIRRRVVFPSMQANEFSDAELEMILTHELTHLKRRDQLRSLVWRTIALVMWFNPFFAWLERRFAAIRELMCDRTTLSKITNVCARDYAALILRYQLKAENSSFAPALGLIRNKKEIITRVEELTMNRNSKHKKSLAIAIAAVALTALAVPTVNLYAAEAKPETNDGEYKATTTVLLSDATGNANAAEAIVKKETRELIEVDETGAPLVATTDMSRYRHDINFLVQQEQYEEALTRTLWWFDNALIYDSGMTGVRLSYFVRDWYAFAEKYPPALEALDRVLAEKIDFLLNGDLSVDIGFGVPFGYSRKGDSYILRTSNAFHLFHDIQSIYSVKGDSAAYIEVFRRLDQEKPEYAKTIYQILKTDFAKIGAKDIIEKYGMDYTAEFDQINDHLSFFWYYPNRTRNNQRTSLNIFNDRLATLVKTARIEDRNDVADELEEKGKSVVERYKRRNLLDYKRDPADAVAAAWLNAQAYAFLLNADSTSLESFTHAIETYLNYEGIAFPEWAKADLQEIRDSRDLSLERSMFRDVDHVVTAMLNTSHGLAPFSDIDNTELFQKWDEQLKKHVKKLTSIRSDYYEKEFDNGIIGRDLAHVATAMNATIDSFLETDLSDNPAALFRILELRKDVGSIDRIPFNLSYVDGKPDIAAFEAVDKIVSSIESGFFSSQK